MSTLVAKEVGEARRLGDHRVVDHELDRDERVDAARGSPPSDPIASRMAARSTIAGTPVRSCMSTRSGLKPISPPGVCAAGAGGAGHGLDVGCVDVHPVLVAQQVLQKDLQAERQALHVEARRRGRRAGGP